MKTDFSKLPREEVEARIVAMLLGDMPAEEARELAAFVDGDAELGRVREELKATIGFVQEASALGAEVKMSEGRRDALLQAFRTVTPPELAPDPRSSAFRTWAALAAMVVFLFGSTIVLTTRTVSRSGGAKYKEELTVASAMPNDESVAVGAPSDGKAQEPFNTPGVSQIVTSSDAAAAGAKEQELLRQPVKREMELRLLADEKLAEVNLAQKGQDAAKTKIELPRLSVAEADSRAKDASGFRSQFGRDVREENVNAPAATEPEVGATLGYAAPKGAREAKNNLANTDSGFVVFGEKHDENAIDAVTGFPAKGGKDVVALNERPALGDKPRFGALFNSEVDANRSAVLKPKDSLAAGDVLRRSDDPAQSGAEMKEGQAQPFVAFGGTQSSYGGYRGKEPSIRGNLGGAAMDGGVAQPVNQVGESADASQVVQDARKLIEAGRLEDAEAVLKKVTQMAPENREAYSYLDQIQEQKVLAETRRREVLIKDKLVDVEKSWKEPLDREKSEVVAKNFPTGAPETSAERQVALRVEREAEELAALRENRKLIEQRIGQEKADVAKAQVEVAERAEIGSDNKKTFLGRLMGRGEERVARVEIAKDATDITPLMPSERVGSYDPYFVQNEIEKIRSQKAFGEVVDTLKLDQKWGAAEGRAVSRDEAIERLKKSVTVEQQRKTGLTAIHAHGDNGSEAAQIANTLAEVYQKAKLAQKNRASERGIAALSKQLQEQDKQIAKKEAELARLREAEPQLAKRPVTNAPVPQPEVLTAENAFSTFSLNVSDVSFKLAAASLEKGLMPEAASVRSEEFINAFDYRDPEPQGAPVGFVSERARYPFAQDRDLVRFSVKTAARGRESGRPLNLVLLLDASGSMERADRVRILQECLRTLAAQLRPEDKVSVVAFARTARLWVDGLPGSQANELAQRVGNLTPEGGTNLEEAMKVAYETARKHFNAGGVNRVVLLTDGAANLGDVEPESLKKKVEQERGKGIALDCFGIGWEGLNDELLETLSRNGDGRYGFVNTPEAAGSEFAGRLAGALQVAASDVKVQVEWNPKRVTAFRQIGYAKHQLTKEQFRDNTVDAAELGAAEAGNALYVVQVNAAGEGPLGTMRVRFKVPGTNDYREHAWAVDYDGASKALENSSYALRLAGTASAFSEWLAGSPFATDVTTDQLLGILSGVPEHFAPDPRPTKLEWMIRQAKSVAGK